MYYAKLDKMYYWMCQPKYVVFKTMEDANDFIRMKKDGGVKYNIEDGYCLKHGKHFFKLKEINI